MSEAAKRREAIKKGAEPTGDQLHTGCSTRKTRDVVAKAVGLSASTIGRAKAVVDAAKAEPDKHGDLLAKMNTTGNVNRALSEVAKHREAVKTR